MEQAAQQQETPDAAGSPEPDLDEAAAPVEAPLPMSQMRSLRDIRIRLQQNWQGYLREYRAFLVLVVLASLADMTSTIYFMLHLGPAAESHPTVRYISYLFGPILGPVFGKAIQVIVVIVLTVFFRRRAIFLFIPIIILYAWAAWYNVWGHYLYIPRIFRILEFLAA